MNGDILASVFLDYFSHFKPTFEVGTSMVIMTSAINTSQATMHMGM